MSTAVEPPSEGLVIWALPRGVRLAGRYLVQEKLGEGAMACVYRALDEVDDTTVALKVLDPLRGADPVGRARFEQEFQVMSRLAHPGVARSLGATRHGELEILVLEFLEGETLQARLERGPLPINAALTAIRRIAEAVAACHAQGVLHRDLKPANVILHPDRGPVILDFGVAWFSAAATLTRTGAVIGSPQYIAPEVLRSSIADPRADVYALGVILFEMLTGATPSAEDIHDPLSWANAGPPPTVFSIRPEVGPDISAVVARAMAPRPEFRYATAKELAKALQRPTLNAGKHLEARLPCPRCGTSRILDLPMCPGCGTPVEWSLTGGTYAVQLDRIRSIDTTTKWLSRRHPEALSIGSIPMLRRRLRFQPVPLAVGVSKVSAEQLASEARDADADASVVQSRALFGSRLKASEASTTEAIVALGWHFVATVGTGLILTLLGVRSIWLSILPAVYGLIGIGAVTLYTRRAVLTVKHKTGSMLGIDNRVRSLAEPLARLAHDRSRHLAAQAFSRATPVVLSSAAPADLKDEVIQHLIEAVNAIERADEHQTFLLAHPRNELAHDIEGARTRFEQHDRSAAETLAALEHRKQALTEAAVAYDVEVRTALDRCEQMSTLVASIPALTEATEPRPLRRLSDRVHHRAHGIG